MRNNMRPQTKKYGLSDLERFVEIDNRSLLVKGRSVTGKISSKIFERMSQNKTLDVIMFTPKAVYSVQKKSQE
jgi:hypothetical protein